MQKRKTAGELSIKAASDSTKYDPLEIGYALTDDVVSQLRICAERHEQQFDEVEYFIILVVAGDPLIKGVRRHKYAALLHMPQPRPQQACFLYNKSTKNLRRLWSMPDAKVMAVISEMKNVSPKWRNTKEWCDAFYRGDFFNFIRKKNNITHLSEHEYLNANREKLIQAGCKEVETSFSDPFDFSKISIQKIVDTKTAVGE
jgi:hypothetical protein